jgi:hypothetical protein
MSRLYARRKPRLHARRNVRLHAAKFTVFSLGKHFILLVELVD